MINGTPQGKGLFAFSDTAGGNACLSLAAMLQKTQAGTPVLYTNNRDFVNNSWNIPVRFTENMQQVDLDGYDYLFTGTSHPASSGGFELNGIRSASAKGLQSISFIDHWVNFRLRFVLDNELILPDYIWVIDEAAKSAAIADGLPAEKISIHANPYHSYLAGYWQSAYRKKEYLATLGLSITDKTRVVIYAPDPVSIRNIAGLPFDEIGVMDILYGIMESLDIPDILLIVKWHPLQPDIVLKKGTEKNSNVRIRQLRNALNIELINCADLVVGFYSNFLLEAAAMNVPVARYFPPSNTQDPLFHLRHKLPAMDKNQLFSFSQFILNK